jgi:hypothetical protein
MLGVVVALAPLATWGLQQLLGLWPAEAVSDGLDTYASFHQRIDGRWLTLEAVTIATAAALLVRLRYPFLVLPIAATLWYLSMDLGAALAGQAADWGASFDFRVRFSLGFGLAMLGAALWLELRGAPDGPDWPFWLHVFGLLAAWPTQFHLVGSTVIGQAGLAVLGAAMVLAGAAIGRRSVSAFGGIGLAVALGRLSWDLLSDSLLLPFGLTALGLGLIGAGVWWTRHGDPIAHALRQALPQPLRAAVLARMARASA